MTPIPDEIAQIKANEVQTQTDVTTLAGGITTLNAKVAALEAATANNDELSPATQALLDDLLATSATVKAAADTAVANIPASAPAVPVGTPPTPPAGS